MAPTSQTWGYRLSIFDVQDGAFERTRAILMGGFHPTNSNLNVTRAVELNAPTHKPINPIENN